MSRSCFARAFASALGIALAMIPAWLIAEDAPPEFKKLPGGLEITIAGKPFATYVYQDEKILRPYFANVHAPSGVQVTRNHPPVEGQDPTDHDTMHPGIWLGFGDINGADFWRNKGRVIHEAFIDNPAAESNVLLFRVRDRYESVGGEVIGHAVGAYAIINAGSVGAYAIDIKVVFTSAKTLIFGDQEEMGLGIRVATPMSVKQGGLLVNGDGLVGEKQVWGKQADWCDYSGRIGGVAAGILLVPSPKNFRRSWFHARDYGLMCANPFGQNAFTGGEKSAIRVEPGDKLELTFGILIHGECTDAELAKWHAETLKVLAEITFP